MRMCTECVNEKTIRMSIEPNEIFEPKRNKLLFGATTTKKTQTKNVKKKNNAQDKYKPYLVNEDTRYHSLYGTM